MLATVTSAITYNGNDATTQFDYPFKIWSSTELEIWTIDAAGAEVQIISNYSLTGIGSSSGGTVTYPTIGDPIATGTKLTLRRILPHTQEFFDPTNNQAFHAEDLEDAIDKTIAQIQQLKAQGDRTLRRTLGQTVDLELPDPVAGTVLAWNPAETGIVNLTVVGTVLAANDVATVNLTDDCVTAAKVNADVAGDGLVQAVGGALAVNVDDVTLEVAADVVQIKANNPASTNVRVSANDTTPGVLNGKLTATTPVTLTENSDGGNETLDIGVKLSYVPYLLAQIDSRQEVDSLDVSAILSDVTGWCFGNSGAKLYITDNKGASRYHLIEYDLSTAYDVMTAVHTRTTDISALVTDPKDIAFNADGTKCFIVGFNTYIYDFTLSTAWNSSTLSAGTDFNATAQVTSARALFFNSAGTKMYVMDSTTDSIFEYDLTAWTVSTAVYSTNVFAFSTEDTVGVGFHITSDGLFLFVSGTATNKIFRYTLVTAWDISSAVVDSQQEFNTTNSLVLGGAGPLLFSPNGTRMYVGSIAATPSYFVEYNSHIVTFRDITA